MSNVKLTIVTVCYNAEDTIESTVVSIGQFKDDTIEYIVVDGLSSDKTITVLDKYKEIVDVLVSENDDGIYDAMNKALDLASGEWIVFIGADDIVEIDLRLLYRYFEDDRAVYYGDCRFLSSGERYDGCFTGLKIFYRNICHQGIFYPRSIYKNYKYNLKYPLRADHDYNVYLFFKYKYIYIDEVVALYNDRGLSSSIIDIAYQNDRLNNYLNVAPFMYRVIVKLQKIIKKLYNTLWRF